MSGLIVEVLWSQLYHKLLGNLNPGWLMLRVFGVIRFLYQRSIDHLHVGIHHFYLGPIPKAGSWEAYTAYYRQFGRNGTPFPPLPNKTA